MSRLCVAWPANLHGLLGGTGRHSITQRIKTYRLKSRKLNGVKKERFFGSLVVVSQHHQEAAQRKWRERDHISDEADSSQQVSTFTNEHLPIEAGFDFRLAQVLHSKLDVPKNKLAFRASCNT